MSEVLCLFIGGALGAGLKYIFSRAALRLGGPDFPYTTLIVNIAGCFMIGLLTAVAEARLILSLACRLFLVIGFCAAFVTFSAFVLETAGLLKQRRLSRAFFNISVGLILGFIFLRAGLTIGEVL